MQTVTFTTNYDHPINETQHEGYLAGQTLDVRDEVAERAIGMKRAKVATKAEVKVAAKAAPPAAPEAPPAP